MRCGIALYASDLIAALPACEHDRYVLHYGENRTCGARAHADISHPEQLRALAESIECSDCDVVSLQHEFGIWGGTYGEHIEHFLSGITKPLVSTLHTTFEASRRPAVQLSILAHLVNRSDLSCVLTESARSTLREALGTEEGAIIVIPHGVPTIPYSAPPQAWCEINGECGTVKLCSIGFFRPDKGIEVILKALFSLSAVGLKFKYVIAGEAQLQFGGQEQYIDDVAALIDQLGLSDCVEVNARFLSRAEQVELVQSAHAGIFAYQDPAHASSGAIPLVLASGRPVICTPFEFAVAKAREVGGVTLATGYDAKSLQEAIVSFLGGSSRYEQEAERLHSCTRHWEWREVGDAYSAAFATALQRRR